MGLQFIEGPKLLIYGYEISGTALDWYAGDPVIVTSGRLVIATSGADVWGIAQANATGTADTRCPVEIILPGQVWSINVDAATTPLHTSHVGVVYTLTIATGATVLNVAGTTSTGWMILDLDTRDVAAAGTRVLVTPSYATCDAIGG